MQGFKSPASAQRFVAINAAVYNIFNVPRHLIRRPPLHSFSAEAHPALNDATVADVLLVDGNPIAQIGILQNREWPLAIIKDGIFQKRFGRWLASRKPSLRNRDGAAQRRCVAPNYQPAYVCESMP
jgi:hypothetical protein